MTEKHGGIWIADAFFGYELIFERYDPIAELIGVVLHKLPNTYRAAVFEKIDGPQWRLPVWSERRPDAIFSDSEQAVAYLDSILRTDQG